MVADGGSPEQLLRALLRGRRCGPPDDKETCALALKNLKSLVRVLMPTYGDKLRKCDKMRFGLPTLNYLHSDLERDTLFVTTAQLVEYSHRCEELVYQLSGVPTYAEVATALRQEANTAYCPLPGIVGECPRWSHLEAGAARHPTIILCEGESLALPMHRLELVPCASFATRRHTWSKVIYLLQEQHVLKRKVKKMIGNLYDSGQPGVIDAQTLLHEKLLVKGIAMTALPDEGNHCLETIMKPAFNYPAPSPSSMTQAERQSVEKS